MNVLLSALINGVIASIPLTLAMWLLLRLVPRRFLNAATRYAAWWVALFVALGLPAWYLMQSQAGRATERVTIEYPPAGFPDSGSPDAGPGERQVLPSLPAGRVPSSLLPALPIHVNSGRWTYVAAGIWCVASLLLLLRLVVSCVVLARRSARASEAPERLKKQGAIWSALCGVRYRRPRVAISEEIRVPVAIGLWRPSILIPSMLLRRCHETELHWIGLHETAHLARGDDYMLLAQRILEALLPWHLPLRLIGRELDLEREIACDDVVVKAIGSANSYATCLTRVVEWCGVDSPASPAVPVVGGESHLALRINALLDKTRHAEPRFLSVAFMTFFVVFASAAWTVGTAPPVVAFTASVAPLPAGLDIITAGTVSGAPPSGLMPVILAERVVASQPSRYAENVSPDYSGQWRVDGVPFAPWILEFQVRRNSLTGAVRQNAMDLPSKRATAAAFPIEISGGRVSDDTIAFKVLGPDGLHVIAFEGRLHEDVIDFTRTALVLEEGRSGGDGIFGSIGAQQVRATRIRTTKGSTRWQVNGVPFGPWTFDLKVEGSHVSGTATQAGWDASSNYITELNYPMEIHDGRLDGTAVSFTVTPDNDRKVTFHGTLHPDRLELAKSVDVREGGDPGRNGLYGTAGLSKFVARRIQ